MKKKAKVKLHNPEQKKIELIDVVELKESAEYKQGRKDASILISMGLSLWFISHSYNLQRKNAQQSHKKLFAYCEGYQDRIEKEAKTRGIKMRAHSQYGLKLFSQDDIGK